ncbi:MAG: hypothetical protein GF383_15200 [Candidatus Lokiarchaeota archaeon]|nr:hypothetical protein [Candidatus Lokiarchaeota archaeon]MBD3342866.1 hypothetical protein [Candidatus Lokiarchaeota archaeon]
MTIKNNYLWKNPRSSFSQLNMGTRFHKKLLVSIIKSFCKPQRKRYDGHSCEEFPIVTLFNALVGNSHRVGTQILNQKLGALLKKRSALPMDTGRPIPHPSQMREYAKHFPMEEANQALLDISREILPLLLKKQFIPKKLNIAFDFHKELYYGKKDNPHVIGIKAEKGTKKAHFWHTCSIILKGREMQVGSEMRKKGEKAGEFVKKMVEFLESLGFIVDLIAMDKEYYQKWIFDYLDGKLIEYIVPVKESEKLRKKKESALKDPKARVQSYKMKGQYTKGKGYSSVTFKVAFYGKKGINFGKLRAQYRNGTRPLSEILADIFVLATNRVIHSPSVKKKYTFYKTRSDYGDRWRIEINYREGNPFVMYSTSADPNVRNFYFILSLLLVNFWIIANVLLHQKRYWLAKEPKAYYKEDLKRVLLNAFHYFMNTGPPLSTFCRTKELIGEGCIII